MAEQLQRDDTEEVFGNLQINIAFVLWMCLEAQITPDTMQQSNDAHRTVACCGGNAQDKRARHAGTVTCFCTVVVSAKTSASKCNAVGETSSRRALKGRALQQKEPSSEGPPVERAISEEPSSRRALQQKEPSSRKSPPAQEPSSPRALQQKRPQQKRPLAERCHEAKRTTTQQMSKIHNTKLAFLLWWHQR